MHASFSLRERSSITPTPGGGRFKKVQVLPGASQIVQTRARYARKALGSTDPACLNGCSRSSGFDLCNRHTVAILHRSLAARTGVARALVSEF